MYSTMPTPASIDFACVAAVQWKLPMYSGFGVCSNMGSLPADLADSTNMLVAGKTHVGCLYVALKLHVSCVYVACKPHFNSNQ